MEPKIIESRHHPLIQHLVKLRKNRHYRFQTKAVFIEGSTLVSEYGKVAELKKLFIEKGTSPSSLRYKELYFLAPSLFEKISGVKTPERIAAEVSLPSPSSFEEKETLLALDGVNDPGNVGTLIRTALALGFEGIFLTEGSADLFNDKAVRAAKGATFHLPYRVGRKEELFDLIQKKGYHIYIGEKSGEPVTHASFSLPLILVLGNEAQGASQEIQTRGRLISIPLAPKVESLNVASAGAILMHKIRESLWEKT